MGPEASSEFFNINGSSKFAREKDRPNMVCKTRGKTLLTKATVQSSNTSLYLNVGSDSTSYKTLTFGTAASTSAWALEGDTIITAQGSTWGRREFFSNLARLREPSPSGLCILLPKTKHILMGSSSYVS